MEADIAWRRGDERRGARSEMAASSTSGAQPANPIPCIPYAPFLKPNTERFRGHPTPNTAAQTPNAQRLRPVAALLAGAGAIGTGLALVLAAKRAVETLTIIDLDYVESTNLNRQ